MQNVFKKPISISSKLMMSSIAVIILIVSLIEICIYLSSAKLQIEDSMQLNQELVSTMGKGFDQLSVSFKRALDGITMEDSFQSALKAVDYLPASDNNLLQLHNILSDNAIMTDEIGDVYLFDNKQQLRDFYKRKYHPGELYVLFPSMSEDWFDPSGKVSSRMLKNKLVFLRTIKDTSTLDNIGYLIAVYDSSELLREVQTSVSNENRFVMVFDKNNNVIVDNYSEKRNISDIIRNVQRTSLKSKQIVRIDGIGNALIGKYGSNYNGWQTVSVVAVDQVVRSSNVNLIIVLALGILGILLGSLIQFFISKKIVGPIFSMVDTVNNVKKNNYHTRMNIHTGDELEALSNAFNDMICTTDTLINKELRDEIKFRDMQLTTLQTQINPHFLANTMECVNCLAEMGRTDDIRKVTVTFCDLMKSAISGPKTVNISVELEYTEKILLIYKILLGDRFNCSIDTSDLCGDVLIPRMIIQPLVENAVIHGIKPSENGGEIRISAASFNEGTLISISDNGIGMNQQEACAINKYAQFGEEPANVHIGVGIRNVIGRLKLIYDEKAVFTISSGCNLGTAIELFLPILNAEDGHDVENSDI